MSGTASRAALLHVALQDLRAGKQLQVERLPALLEALQDEPLAELIAAEVARAATQAARLDALGSVAGGPANLWMQGILDDGERDARSHQRGAIRDIALVGALRKAKVAEIVSSETAIALAMRDGAEMLAALKANRAEEVATDHALHERLESLAAR